MENCRSAPLGCGYKGGGLMAHKCYISFKTEDKDYKEYMQESLHIDMIDKSLNEPIESQDSDYIMRRIREEYIQDSTVTISLIGEKSNENLGWKEQQFIKRELQATLFNSDDNPRGGILGVVLPAMIPIIYQGTQLCLHCNNHHNIVKINDATVIKEFSYNYYIPHNKCAWAEEDRYCVLVPWNEFKDNPEKYIEQAFQKREFSIAEKTKVYV